MIDLLLIHGWGLSHDMWNNFTNNINQKMNIYYASPYDNALDSINNFYKNYKKTNNKLIIISHSLGGLKILSSNIYNVSDAIILINSFTKFSRSEDFKHGINSKILSLMIKNFLKNPKDTLINFLDNNNILTHIEDQSYIQDINKDQLLKGLQDLQDMDCRSCVSNKSNIYTIQGGLDPLISKPMQDEIANNDNICNIIYADAGHFIPYTHAKDLIDDVNKIINSISNKVVCNFNNKSLSYDNNAHIQEIISDKLIHYLQDYFKNHNIDHINNILELGCGTGLFTKHLVKEFQQASIVSTDLSFNMLKKSQSRLYDIDHEYNYKNLNFKQVNALTEMENFKDNSLDLICSSMLFQWFEDPIKVLKLWQSKLKPDGIFAISLLGNKSFESINDYIRKNNYNNIFNSYPSLDYFYNSNIDVYEDDCYFDYDSLKSLLKTMINTGANHNKNNNKSNSELKDLLKEFDSKITIRWNSIFLVGRLE